jgi:phosphoglycolate phosphatase-like HAD superfamily hydrolase
LHFLVVNSTFASRAKLTYSYYLEWVGKSTRETAVPFARRLKFVPLFLRMDRLILFDIDGTLTRTQNGYLPFNEAIFDTFGVAGDIRTVVPDGNTDPMIVEDIFAKGSIEIEIKETDWQRFTLRLRERYHHHVLEGTTTIQPLPGAAELLRALALAPEFSASVVTGNLEVTAEIKLEAAGLAPYLRRGAYASDSRYRADLPAIAKKRCENLSGRSLPPERCVVIGDTPNDLEAAKRNQMKCILVGTGRYPIEELQHWQPDGCLAALSDTETVLAMLAQV